MDIVLLVLAGLSVAVSLLLHASAHLWLRRPPPRSRHRPPITVLKPLRGVDDGLYENLISFVRQNYPDFQVVLGTEDPDDPALDVARRLQREFPAADVHVVAGAEPLGYNPKVVNLASLARHARHELWLISDSNVRVGPTYLRDLSAELQQPGVGMVFNVFYGTRERSLGALLENLHLTSWVPGGTCGTQLLFRKACVTGKSMLFRKGDLERLGGFESVKDILAEDYVLGRRFERDGLGVVTSRLPIATVNRRWTLRRFLNRHLRWATIRRRLAPGAYCAEPLLNPVLFGTLLAAAGMPLAGLACVLAKVGSDALLARRLRGRFPPPWQLAAIPLKDLLFAGIWVVGAFRRRAWWRGHPLVVGAGTVVSGTAPRQPVLPAEPASTAP